MSYLTRIEAKPRVRALTEELKSASAKHQASNSAYEVEIICYIDLATVEELKAKDYQESFEQFREELRLESFRGCLGQKQATFLLPWGKNQSVC